ncbi:PAS domain-containing sensor histidine kinase [Pseudomonas daroniae]|uniref:histidine kinase n=1 Tax=Phytopseudomonas daroniae TaxID=2487519 RepID=A0A4Q9QQ61_9GAMM|nr:MULTISPECIES: PAS domain-containing sensor histidine kinase [Pseudomonas]TBU81639.1 PAS domain-containing sensor histidine kinase [Pseudomonas daroniae]TBU84197.1 PAS domain-containing sensor histidine kinase [Pseudomonas sp. FRB 228]TBU88579.1 PAS domain-containing sensor histidine kinase [Pseudomonas daroniae]
MHVFKDWFKRESDSPVVREAPGISANSSPCLNLSIDLQGQVLEVSGNLSSRLRVSAQQTTALEDLLYGQSRYLVSDLGAFAQQMLDLSFTTRDGGILHTRGWMQAVPDGWSLQAFEVGDFVARLQACEQRLQVFAQVSSLAQVIRSTERVELSRQLPGWLATLAQTLQVTCVALAVPDTLRGGWQIAGQHSDAMAPAFWEDGQQLPLDLCHYDAQQPVQWLRGERDGPEWHAGDSVWLVPYSDYQGARAWLLCSPYIAHQHMPELNTRDWLDLFAHVAAPLLQRLDEQARKAHGERLDILQDLLGTGWWEYLPRSGAFLLAPNLVQRFALDPQASVTLADWLELLSPADRDEFQVRLADAETAGKPFEQIVRLRDDEKGLCWFRIHTRILTVNGQHRIVGAVLDIDDMKGKELEADAATARLKNLVASAPALIYVQRYEEGAFALTFCSDSTRALLGYTLDDLIRRPLADFIHPDDRDTYFTRTRTLLAQGAASCSYRFIDSDGEYHWLQDEVKLLRDERGIPVEAVGLCLDVTDAALAAERVRESEERYRILVEDSPAIICRYQPDLSLTFANRPLAQYLGISQEKLQGISLAAYLSQQELAQFQERHRQLTPQQPVGTALVRMDLPGREHVWWELSERGVFSDSGKLLEVQAVGRDDTELQKARQMLNQSAKMAVLGEMATGLAHEINQPLNVMRIALTNTLNGVENGSATPDYLKNKLERIEQQVARAAKIVNHMRIFGRRSEVEGDLFSPDAAIEGALTLIREGELSKDIELTVKLCGSPQVKGHADQLEQVIINLLVNARDALLSAREKNPGLEPHILVQSERDASLVIVQIQDNAGGIDPLLLDRVFDPFFTTKPVGKGTGLGLSVSYGLVSQMGGKLGVSNREHGACFRIELPAA